eukprot:scaffold7720_cov149-Amphora_coffeaeformis.AAC.2
MPINTVKLRDSRMGNLATFFSGFPYGELSLEVTPPESYGAVEKVVRTTYARIGLRHSVESVLLEKL